MTAPIISFIISRICLLPGVLCLIHIHICAVASTHLGHPHTKPCQLTSLAYCKARSHYLITFDCILLLHNPEHYCVSSILFDWIFGIRSLSQTRPRVPLPYLRFVQLSLIKTIAGAQAQVQAAPSKH
ncbi:hypothetical protein BKA67DRAFT_113790 [Truncatella angustata]|uniref:Uncharacterized protein n=1 Tax=Truncatella angustata TaxID=152316 RepID=A0A9P8RGE4_9PEZI|nr:uncharacterized protein BKA67DRAFT_113790 [Truncatella angustata]KAH6645498.1 hypothetical protein BKA67DRAFT_113790 [Truncatella angustata]